MILNDTTKGVYFNNIPPELIKGVYFNKKLVWSQLILPHIDGYIEGDGYLNLADQASPGADGAGCIFYSAGTSRLYKWTVRTDNLNKERYPITYTNLNHQWTPSVGESLSDYTVDHLFNVYGSNDEIFDGIPYFMIESTPSTGAIGEAACGVGIYFDPYNSNKKPILQEPSETGGVVDGYWNPESNAEWTFSARWLLDEHGFYQNIDTATDPTICGKWYFVGNTVKHENEAISNGWIPEVYTTGRMNFMSLRETAISE